MKNTQILSQLKVQLKFMEDANLFAPFPVYDTGDILILRNKMAQLEAEEKCNYDELPVVACKNCKSLHIVVDEVDNSICMRCNSINELVEFPNIFEYKKEKNIWNEE